MPALSPGVRLGPYEVVGLLGAGGMGEVYRAQDTKLGRGVALKILSDAFADDSDRLTRFKREAKALAALNHPHIAALFGMEEADGRHFLIMELVDGETLADRIGRGPLAVDAALRVARQIAEALEAAHEKGIVHRDLKPANVKITADEKVKVLDFGLAKLGAADGSAAAAGPTAAALTHSPTLSMMATQAGVILGTAAYMSPEQAQGMTADQRSDVFSFGSVLFEMLTGRQAFRGDSAPAILAAVLIGAPDLSAMPANLNARLVDLVRRCLEKNPKQRWQAVGDLRMELEAIAATPHADRAAAAALAQAPLWRRAIPVAIGVLLTAVVTSAAWQRFKPDAPASTVTRFTVPLGDGQRFTNAGRQIVGLSPDGTQIVYVANNRLYLRAMADPDARPIPGAEALANVGVTNPVFSPDGRSIVFFSGPDLALKKIAVIGGAAVTLCAASNPFGMSWNASGILFGQPSGIMRVSANGGKPELLIALNAGEVGHGPQLLPDNDTVLFTLATGSGVNRWDTAHIVVQSLKSGRRTTIVEGGSDARYVTSGHIVYAISGVLYAIPFDAGRLRTQGGQVPVVEGVSRSTGQTGSAHFSVSNNGSLIYVPGLASVSSAQRVFALFDRKGGAESLKIAPAAFEMPRVSPDGKQIAAGVGDGSDANIWVYDLSGTIAGRRLTFGGRNRFPLWSPDGKRVAFQSDRDGDTSVYSQLADGTGAPERLTKAENGAAHIPESWSPTGDVLLFSDVRSSGASLLMLTLKDKQATPFGDVRSSIVPGVLPGSTFSSDGRWVAYAQREGSAEPAIYVQPFPPTGAKYQIWAAAIHPVWSREGQELFGVQRGGNVVATTITTNPTFAFSESVGFSRAFLDGEPINPRDFDVIPGGQRFLVLRNASTESPATSTPQIQVVLSWLEELKQRVPATK